MALTKITPQMFDTSAAGHDFNIDNGTFVVDASANRVGIGTSSPSEKLDVDGIIQINRTGDHPAIRFLEGGTTRGYIGSADWAVTGGGTADFGISSGSSGNLLLGTNAGVERMRIASDGTIQIPNQNAINELQFTGTEHTNIYSSTTAGMDIGTTGSGYLRFLTNNVERIRILSNGRVGIGTGANVDYKLHLEESDTTPVYLSTQNSAGALLVGNNSEGNSYVSAQTSGKPLLLETENTERMRINARGALVFNPSSGTEVNNSIVAHTNNYMYMFGNTDGLILQNNIVGDARILIDDANTMRFQTSSAERMRITSAGAVAIGRTSSITAACLELQPPAQISDFSSYILNIGGDEADDAVGTKSGIGFGYTSSARTAAPATIGYETQATTGGTYGDLYFATRQGDGTGQPTVRMRINNDGHVTAPYNPAFRAYLSTEQTSNGLVSSGWSDSGLAEGRTYDRDGDFNTSTGRFTAPVDGIYLFSVMWDSNASQAGFDLLVNPTNAGNGFHVRWEPTGRSDNAWESRHFSTHIKLDKDDYVMLGIRHASGSYPVHMGGGYWGHFAGCLIS